MMEKKNEPKLSRMVFDEFHYADREGKTKVAMAELPPEEGADDDKATEFQKR